MCLVLEDAGAGWSVVNLAVCQNREGGGREFSNHSYLTLRKHRTQIKCNIVIINTFT